jgi:hypothetical protein
MSNGLSLDGSFRYSFLLISSIIDCTYCSLINPLEQSEYGLSTPKENPLSLKKRLTNQLTFEVYEGVSANIKIWTKIWLKALMIGIWKEWQSTIVACQTVPIVAWLYPWGGYGVSNSNCPECFRNSGLGFNGSRHLFSYKTPMPYCAITSWLSSENRSVSQKILEKGALIL